MANEIAIRLLATRLSIVQQNQIQAQSEADGARSQMEDALARVADCGVQIDAIQSAIKVLSN